MIKKLTVLSSMSGGGKSTYVKKNYKDRYVMPDTNVKVYEIYHKLFRGPALDQGLEPDKLTGTTLWSAKYMSDMTFLKGMEVAKFHGDLPNELVNMRSGWDYLIYDELYLKRNIIKEDDMYSYIRDIESQFYNVKYLIWNMQDEKIIEELMSRDDDRAHLFNSDPKMYQEWQSHYIKRYKEIMEKYKYNYEIKTVKYNK